MVDLCSAFGDLGLAKDGPWPVPFHNHLLKTTYPALDLLPKHVTPYFYPPKDLRLRKKPKLGRYHRTSTNLAFWHRFAIDPNSDGYLCPKPGAELKPHEMVALIDSLECSAGTSDLDIASFDSGSERGIVHVFYLYVSWATCSRAFHGECRIPANQLDQLVKSSRHPWLALVSDLIYRSSDRAYLHVAQNLHENAKAVYRGEGAHWARDWAITCPRRGWQMLMAHFGCQLGDGSVVPLIELDGENLTAHQTEKIPVIMPCGHSADLVLKTLSLIEDARAAEMACSDCGERILSEADMAELALTFERSEREAFFDSEAEHNDKIIPVPVEGRPELKIAIPPGALHHALQDALESLRVPESMSPRALS